MDYSLVPEKKWEKMHRSFLHSTGIKRREEIMREFFDLMPIRVWLGMSALLGIYREGDLIERDEDVDFFCFAEELQNKHVIIINRLLKNGFSVRGYKNKGRIIAYKDGEEMALMGHFKKGPYRWFKNRRVPERFFSNGCIVYKEKDYPCMFPIEEYLEWQYKNWKKPYYGDPGKRDKYMNKKKVKK